MAWRANPAQTARVQALTATQILSGPCECPRRASYNVGMRPLQLCLMAVLAASALRAQTGYQVDLRSVSSPDGKWELQVFVGQPIVEGTTVWPRLAYRVMRQGKAIVETSFLGVEPRGQNPLGEKPGLMKAESGTGNDAKSGAFNWLLSHFIQNGSQGRLYDVEARAYDTGVAFRFHIPWSAPMDSILLEDENTEFQFPAGARAQGKALADLPIDIQYPLPFDAELPGLGWVRISQSGAARSMGAATTYPPVSLQHDTSSVQGPTMTTRLGKLPEKPWLALESLPDFATPWRVISFATQLAALRSPQPE
jgi:hypothetical protein